MIEMIINPTHAQGLREYSVDLFIELQTIMDEQKMEEDDLNALSDIAINIVNFIRDADNCFVNKSKRYHLYQAQDCIARLLMDLDYPNLINRLDSTRLSKKYYELMCRVKETCKKLKAN